LKEEHLFQRMDLWARHLLPVVLTLVLVLLGAIPTHLPGFAAITPMLPLIGIYYWGIYRPDLLPGSVAFAIGLVNDIITGMPLGVTPLIYLLVQAMTASQRRFFLGKPFLVAWWCFAVVAGGALSLQWLLVSMSAYPLLSWLFARTQLTLLRPA